MIDLRKCVQVILKHLTVNRNKSDEKSNWILFSFICHLSPQDKLLYLALQCRLAAPNVRDNVTLE